MKSNKQYTFFNKNLYKEGLRQLMLLGFVCMGLIALITVCIPISSMLAIKSYSTGTIYPEIVSVGSTFLYLYSIFIFVTPMLSLTTFHFLTKRNSSDVYHATPCTRGCIFNTYFACIVT